MLLRLEAVELGVPNGTHLAAPHPHFVSIIWQRLWEESVDGTARDHLIPEGPDRAVLALGHGA